MDWTFLTPLLGGALGAAFINGTVALYKLKRDKADEHDKWLRDNKQGAYARFISAVVEASLTLSPEDKGLEAQQKTAVALSEIRLVGPPNVRDAAVALSKHSGRLFKLASERRRMITMDYDANKEQIKKVGEELSVSMQQIPELTESFVTVARLDIRTETGAG